MTMQYPPLIERLDRQTVEDSVRARIQTLLPQWQPRPAGDSRYQAAIAHADAVYALRVYLNARAASQLISFASGEDLDAIGAFIGVQRGNGQGDDAYRSAIIAQNQASKPGTPEYLDAQIATAAPAVFDHSFALQSNRDVWIYVLSSDSGSALYGTPAATLITALQTYVNDESRRLISDNYVVQTPTITGYRVEADITGGNQPTILAMLRGYAQTLVRLGGGVTRAGYIRAALNAGASNASITLKQADNSALPGGAVDLAPVKDSAYSVRDNHITAV